MQTNLIGTTVLINDEVLPNVDLDEPTSKMTIVAAWPLQQFIMLAGRREEDSNWYYRFLHQTRPITPDMPGGEL